MNQDRNPYIQSHEGYPPYPNQQQGEYLPQQPGGFPSYPPQQSGGFPPYPPQQSGGFPPQQSGGFPPNAMPFQPPPMLPRLNFPKDDEQGTGQWGNFNTLDNKEIRRVFIRKVYAILMIQLSITFGIIALFPFIPAIRDYVRGPNGQWLYWTSYVVFLVTYFVLVCSKRVARKYPINLVLLGALTLAMGYMMGMISAFYKIESVLIAVGITAFICFGITLFSFQTKYDFTSCVGVMFVVSLGLLGFGIVCAFTYSRIMYTVYAGLGAIAFSIFLAIDTQLIMGGKRHEISAEDHVYAAIMLYIDIVYIFMFILSLFGSRE